MPTLLLTRGIPGSGKSTFAKEWVREDPAGRVRINRDELRQTLYATSRTLLSSGQEKHVSVVEKSIARDALADGLDVVVDATNLNPRYVKAWFALGHPVEFRDFEVDLETALAQNAERVQPIPEDAIRRMFTRYTKDGKFPSPPTPNLPPTDVYEPDWELPTAVLVDIDGTLAHNVTGRSFFDMERVGEDTVDDSVRAVVNTLQGGHLVILMSGREKSSLRATQLWLRDNSINHDYLYMRETGDQRPDTLIKRELFDTHVRGRFNVIGVIDDRPSVCREWRAMGLKTFQVGNPHHEF